MLAEAYYNDGKLEFTRKLTFRHTRFKVRVELPDEEVTGDVKAIENNLLPDSVITLSGSYMQNMMECFEEIRTMPLNEATIPELTDKQLQRCAAFETPLISNVHKEGLWI